MKTNEDAKYIYDINPNLKFLNDNDAFDKVVADNFNTREKLITNFVLYSVSDYSKRLKSKIVYQHIISILLLIIASLISFTLITLVFLISFNVIQGTVNIISLLTSVGVAFISSVFALLTIVVKYIFPERDSEYSLEILKSISNTNQKYYNKVKNNPHIN